MVSGRSYLQDVKKKAKCRCGEYRTPLLEFSHYDRKTKLTKNGKKIDMSSIQSKKEIMKELKKGEYMCVVCHRLETSKENEIILDKCIQTLVLQCTFNFDDKGKICNGIFCNGKKQKKNKFKTCKSKCDSCVALEKIQKRKIRQKYINEMKLEIGHCEYCHMVCEKKNVQVFEWDHIFGKNCNVSKMTDNSFRRIDNEVKLCRLLCAKCHRLKSILEARDQWYDNPKDFITILDK